MTITRAVGTKDAATFFTFTQLTAISCISMTIRTFSRIIHLDRLLIDNNLYYQVPVETKTAVFVVGFTIRRISCKISLKPEKRRLIETDT